MKLRLTLLMSLATVLVSSHTFAADTPPSKDISISINDVFVPGGFDSTSDSYVVVSGIFPNGCYKWKGVTRADLSKFEHEITSVASVSQGMCLMVLVPFTKDVRLGQLDSGSHLLRFKSGDGTYLEKRLQIE